MLNLYAVNALNYRLKLKFSDILGDVKEDEMEMGFIEPGHGAKGKQHWIVDDDDLCDMYKTYKDIMLWVYLGTRKRPHSPDPESSSKGRKTKYDVHTHRMMELEEIADDLETRHGYCYTREQYNVWAHMIHLKKHHSRDNAHDKPFFSGSRSKKPSVSCESTHPIPSTSTSGNSSPLPTGILPDKRIQLRSQSMQQLEMWHSLYEKGAVEEEEYKKVQDNILSDIKHF